MLPNLTTTRNVIKLVLASLLLYLVIFLSPIERVTSIVYKNWPTEQVPHLHCHSVLTTMTNGHWIDLRHRANRKELDKLEYFLHSARQQHFLPYDLQRPDRRCGNITFGRWSGKMNNLLWFRALCDPNGDYPCCYDNHCESRPVTICRCDNCYDLRQQVYAEFASWVPSEPTCQIHHFTGAKDTCLLLRNMTIYIIGDSFLRHLYISLLSLLRSNTSYGPLYQYSPQGMIQACDKNFVYLRMCMKWIDRESRECNKRVKLKFLEYVMADQSTKILEAIQEVQNIPNSMVLIGIGIHDDFNLTSISDKLIYPLLAQLSRSHWPEVVWAGTHAPGLLKSPRIPSQSTDSIAEFNAKTKAIFSAEGIPVFDTFQLTAHTMSYDGVHFGQGVNNMKAQILLNHILEQKGKRIKEKTD